MLAHQAGAWTFEPGVVLGLVAAATVYARGRRRLGRRPRRTAAFVAGLAVLVVALLSPLDGHASHRFAAHMVQHLLLMSVAAPLLVLARPAAALVAGLPPALDPRGLRGRVRLDLLTHPLVVWGLGTVIVWAWHMPALYDAALSSDLLHAVEHATFLATGYLFWWFVLRRRTARPVATLVVFANGVQSSALGAVLVFASTPLYPEHTAGLSDQQLAGALMWGPPAFLYLVTMGWLLVRWFGEMERLAPVLPLLLLVVLGACSYLTEEPEPYRTAPYYGAPQTATGQAAADTGQHLYQRDCSYCHGSDGRGTDRGPDLISGTNGAALVDFVLRTGRMPVEGPVEQTQAARPVYDEGQIAAIVQYVTTQFRPEGPPIPDVDPRRGDLPHGQQVWQEHCAACHATTGIGGAMLIHPDPDEARKTEGIVIPGIENSDAREIAEAVRAGPGSMPVFGPRAISDEELDSLTAYVLYLQDPRDEGGAPIGRVGPVVEGAVGWIVGLGVLLLFIRWIGTKAGETP
ncbi:MAG: cytochrome c oxidase assembly protein [Acidimicrobiia bacterium]